MKHLEWKIIETESFQVLEGRGNGELMFTRYRVSVYKVKRPMEMNDGNDFTIL